MVGIRCRPSQRGAGEGRVSVATHPGGTCGLGNGGGWSSLVDIGRRVVRNGRYWSTEGVEWS